MRAGKARTLQTTLQAAAARQPVRRCICEFSTTCKSSQHDHQPPPAASASKYDRLWDGLFHSMDSLKVSGPRKAPRASPIPSRQAQFSRPGVQSATQGHEDASTPPSISRFRAAFLSQLPPSSSTDQSHPTTGGKSTSHFGKMTAPHWTLAPMEASRETHLPERASESGTDSQIGTASSRSSGAVSWAELLDKIQQTRETNYPSLPTDYRHRDVPSRSQSSPQPLSQNGQDQGSLPLSRAAHIDESLHDRIFETQAESRRYSLALQEELRELQSPAEALNWLQDRLLDQSNENSLMSKIASTPGAIELHNLYGDLLVDLTNFLRTTTSPQSAFLPLILAKAHSPTSYLYGCTAKLYAANIRAKWEMYGDIQGILELIQDMEKGAVHLNPLIKDYVKNMSLAVVEDRMRAQRELVEEEEAAQLAKGEEVQSQHIDSRDPEKMDNLEVGADPKLWKIRNALKFSNHPKIEGKLFFTSSQHRALREIERLVIQDQERYFEARAREDNLRDNLISRHGKSGSPYHPDSLGTIQHSKQEEDEVSDVNALIASYGKAIPAYSERRQLHPFQKVAVKKPPRGVSSAPLGSPASRPSSEVSSPIPAGISFDVLAEAVSEASQERKSKKKAVSRSQKKYQRSVGKSSGNLKASESCSEQKEISPRLSI